MPSSTPSSPSSHLQARVRILVDGSLLLQRTTPDDAGKYTCIASNGLWKPPSASAFVTVLCKSLGAPCGAAVGSLTPSQHPSRPHRPSTGDHHAPRNPPAQGHARHHPVPHQSQPPSALRQLDTRWAPAGAGQGGAAFPHPAASLRPLGFTLLPFSQFPGWSTRPDGSIVIATGNDDALGLYSCTPYNSYGTAGASRPTRVLLKVRMRSGDGSTAPSCCLLPPSPRVASSRIPQPSRCVPRRNISRRWAGSW